jgi:glycosyltransferase involved in cell wall biosynthesis
MSGTPELSVVSPAFNQETTVVQCLDRLMETLDRAGVDYEIIVVSDGSRDSTPRMARLRESSRVRVIEYERNMGKGYALRVGSAAARGRYVAWLDSDLDLDPRPLLDYLVAVRDKGFDVIVGSKRHKDSLVDYPRSRRAYSWLFQRLVRLMFQLDVRDTQVGMKLFRADVLQQVLPTVVVKRYAFDLEVLAVARRFGFTKIAEAPVRLDYQFTGTGMNWRAIANALWDTAAVFYRLRLLRFYDRQRQMAARIAAHAGKPIPPLAVVLTPDRMSDEYQAHADRIRALVPAGTTLLVVARGDERTRRPHTPRVIVLPDAELEQRARRGQTEATSEIVAFLEPGAEPADQWAEAALLLLRDPSIGAVVGPTVPRLTGEAKRDAAGILSESRMGVGGARIRHHVGRLHEVDDFPARNLFVRREPLSRLLDQGGALDDSLCSQLAKLGSLSVLCSPDVVAITQPTPLFRPYLSELAGLARRRGDAAPTGRRLRPRHLAPMALVAFLAATPLALLAGSPLAFAWLTVVVFYVAVLVGYGLLIGVLHRRPLVGVLAACGAALSHLVVGALLIAETFKRVVLRRGRPQAVSPPSLDGGFR